MPHHGRMILAGGPNRENIENAIESIRSYAEDVSSGVEGVPGKKAPRLLAGCVKRAKAYPNPPQKPFWELSGMKTRRLLFLSLLPVFSIAQYLGLVGHELAGADENEQVQEAPGESIRVEADHLMLDGKRSQGTATGNVRISHRDTVLEAEEVFLDLEDKTSYAKERVRLLRGGDILECDVLTYHWEAQTGSLEDAELIFTDTGYHVRAGLLEKTGPDTYLVEGGTFTTCRCPSPEDRLPWEMRGQEGEITLGGYARIKKATFLLYQLPVLYLPTVYVPVKLHRESGFLMPDIGESGRHGWEFSLPYFWAINASLDTTLTLEGLTERGFKPSWEFRYRPNKRTAGQWVLSVIPDQKADEFRYGLTAGHKQKLSSSFYDKVELKVVSENAYTVDFPDEVGHTADRILESRGIVGFRDGNLHATLEGDFADLVVGTGGDRIPQPLPHLHFDLVSRPVAFPWVSAGWRSEAIHFLNEKGDQRVREQLFPQGWVRIRPMPGLSLGGHFGIREVLSQYVDESFGAEGSQHRTLLESGADLEGSIGRGYRWGSYRLFHIVRPRVRYQWIRNVASDPFPVVMDGLDQLERRNWITYSIYTSLWGQVQDPEPPGLTGLAGEMYVAQSLDLEQDPRDSPSERLFSDVLISFRVQPRTYFALASNLQIDPYNASMRVVEVGTSLSDKKKRYALQVGFLEHEPHRIDPLTRVELWDAHTLVYFFPGIGKTILTRLEAHLFSQWSAQLTTHYLLESSGKIENHLSVSYLSVCKCWWVNLKVYQRVRPDDVGFSVQFRLEGLGSYF